MRASVPNTSDAPSNVSMMSATCSLRPERYRHQTNTPIMRTPTAHRQTTRISRPIPAGGTGTDSSSFATPRIHPAAPTAPPKRESVFSVSRFDQECFAMVSGVPLQALSYSRRAAPSCYTTTMRLLELDLQVLTAVHPAVGRMDLPPNLGLPLWSELTVIWITPLPAAPLTFTSLLSDLPLISSTPTGLMRYVTTIDSPALIFTAFGSLSGAYSCCLPSAFLSSAAETPTASTSATKPNRT